MNTGRIFIVCMLVLFTILNSVSIPHASSPLKYNAPLSPSAKYIINQYFEEIFGANISVYDIAAIDLNEDGIDEFIAKRKTCTIAGEPCSHLILAEKRGKIVQLSTIRAKNLIVANTKSYGISDILAFKDNINSNDFDIYVWSPIDKMYILKQSEDFKE